MFSALTQANGLDLQTKRVLIIINVQNDSLLSNGDIYITKSHDFVDKIKTVVPSFRSMGEIVWVKTEITRKPGASSSNPIQVEMDAAKADEKNRLDRQAEEQHLEDDTSSLEGDSGVQTYHPSNRSKAMMKQASASNRLEQRSNNMQVFNDKDDILEDRMAKPRKGTQPTFYVGGTHGAELADEILPFVDHEKDLFQTKHFYSAFDQTSLLMTLRMKLVTEVYLCGCLTNVSIYATAADAVQHGMEVTVVEDCLGYRSEEKHEEAMRQMADIMGVNGIDSEEIIEESGGIPPPDAEVAMFTGPGIEGIALNSLSLTSGRKASGESGAGSAGDAQKAVLTDSQQRVPEVDPSLRIREALGDPGAAKSAPKGTQPVQTKRLPSESKATPAVSPRVSLMRSRDSWPLGARTLGPNDAIGTGDSRIVHDVLDSKLAGDAFERLKKEVKWRTMNHRSGQVPRLVAVQGEIGENSGIPIYRHPADESPALQPFSPCVEEIRKQLEAQLKQSFNHALIQLYRDGNDNISEHSDKTLDIVRNSSIVNMSVGAQRVMTLRTKKSKRASGAESPSSSRQSQRVPMPHNSVFVLGPQTNMQWLHGVRADKRPPQQKSEEEKSYGGERISLTFRQIGTFTDQKKKKIWGQGARKKSFKSAGYIRSTDTAEMDAMVIAFGKENHQTEFDWQAEYGQGFDVINLVSSEKPKLILCGDKLANLRVQLSLLEKKIQYTMEERSPDPNVSQEARRSRYKSNPFTHSLSNIEKPVFKDTDDENSETEGDLAILFYLEKFYPFEMIPAEDVNRTSTRNFSRAAQSNELLFLWRDLQATSHSGRPQYAPPRDSPSKPNTRTLMEFERDIDKWEGYAKDGKEFIAGGQWTLIDCAFWPVLNEIVHTWQGFKVQKYPELSAYHERVLGRECVKRLLEGEE